MILRAKWTYFPHLNLKFVPKKNPPGFSLTFTLTWLPLIYYLFCILPVLHPADYSKNTSIGLFPILQPVEWAGALVTGDSIPAELQVELSTPSPATPSPARVSDSLYTNARVSSTNANPAVFNLAGEEDVSPRRVVSELFWTSGLFQFVALLGILVCVLEIVVAFANPGIVPRQ